jgi:hypothetical protein
VWWPPRCKQQQWQWQWQQQQQQQQQHHGETDNQPRSLPVIKELLCWPHDFQIVMISKHIIIIFMNINPNRILEPCASKKDNFKTQKFPSKRTI